ncbi:UNKNOWN [Stylonychia lemnae]|uniref:Uncharacterized protein n=1 Tax=Stylonychia lemnae TaxID=5949 RepID=A0A078APQ3_STYLE|nr:UNKNOWN [Stylonychia lemnae]|eukprot:CDW82888.1 UNKNOWN [Stylonychia lemnae]
MYPHNIQQNYLQAHVQANLIGDHNDGFQNSRKTNLIQTLAAQTLGNEYKATYDFTSGFLYGSSYSENKECVENLNDITYYGLLLLQGAQNLNFQNSMNIPINSNKFTEATGIFNRQDKLNYKNTASAMSTT